MHRRGRFPVHDDWQEKGIGTLLMRKLIEVGKAKGLAGFEDYVQADNTRMLDILLQHGFMAADLGNPTTLHMRLQF